MTASFARGKYAIAECDRCGFRYKLKELKPLTIKTKNVNILVCPTCFEKDQPQLQLGMFPVNDPQAIRNPRPDLTRFPESGSRNYQYGFDPVGLRNPFNLDLIDNLKIQTNVGTVTITIS
jgi:hypothetical protein|tara:strand:- start:3516 stop:3875 length:360 start_codon:yes stop_codon:yes gene_type:complete